MTPKRLALAFAISLLAAPLAAQNIGGLYDLEGIGLNGEPYYGEVEIVLTSDVTCAMVWRTGNSESHGICMRMEEVFTAAYEIEGEVGLAIYGVLDDGTLAGTWTVSGINAVGEEVLTPR